MKDVDMIDQRFGLQLARTTHIVTQDGQVVGKVLAMNDDDAVERFRRGMTIPCGNIF
jgi:hypothetical protein